MKNAKGRIRGEKKAEWEGKEKTKAQTYLFTCFGQHLKLGHGLAERLHTFRGRLAAE